MTATLPSTEQRPPAPRPARRRARRPAPRLRRPSRSTLRGWAPVALAGALALGGALVVRTALIEDTYITLVYARNLAEHLHWGLLPEVTSNTATSPLNAIVLALFTTVTGDPLRAVLVVSVLNAMLMAWGLRRLGVQWGVGDRLAWIVPPLLLLDPHLVATVGMETLLCVTVLVWLLRHAAAGDARGFGWVAGVALVTRADLAVVVAVVWLAHSGLRRPLLRSTVALLWRLAAVALPWYVVSWVLLGSAIPDTLALKEGASWGHYWDGLWTTYLHVFPGAVWPSLLLLAGGLLAAPLVPLLSAHAFGVRRLAPLAGVLAGASYYVTFGLLRVPHFAWYYGLPVAGATLTLGWVLAVLPDLTRPARRSARRTAGRVLAVVLTLALLAPSAAYWASRADDLPLTSPPVELNWASTGQYRTIGEDLHRRFGGTDVGIRSLGEFGEILYYCRCRVIDRFDSRYLVKDLLAEQRRSSPLMRLNYLFYDERDERPLGHRWHLYFTRVRPTTTPSWPVSTPFHRSGWVVMLRAGEPPPVGVE